MSQAFNEVRASATISPPIIVVITIATLLHFNLQLVFFCQTAKAQTLPRPFPVLLTHFCSRQFKFARARAIYVSSNDGRAHRQMNFPRIAARSKAPRNQFRSAAKAGEMRKEAADHDGSFRSQPGEAAAAMRLSLAPPCSI